MARKSLSAEDGRRAATVLLNHELEYDGTANPERAGDDDDERAHPCGATNASRTFTATRAAPSAAPPPPSGGAAAGGGGGSLGMHCIGGRVQLSRPVRAPHASHHGYTRIVVVAAAAAAADVGAGTGASGSATSTIGVMNDVSVFVRLRTWRRWNAAAREAWEYYQ